MGVDRRPVHRLIACAARPCGVPAAVAEAGLVPYEDLVGAEGVAVGAALRWVGDPVPGGGLNQIAQRGMKAIGPRFLDHALLWLWRVGVW